MYKTTRGSTLKEQNILIYQVLQFSVREFYLRRRLFGEDVVPGSTFQLLAFTVLEWLNGSPPPVNAVCNASGYPHATALRKIESLVQAQLLERIPCPNDKRTTNIAPTQSLIDYMDEYSFQLWSLIRGQL